MVLTALAVSIALVGCGGDDEPDRADPADGGSSAGENEEAVSAATTDAGEVRYMAIGDSLSQGVGATDEATGSFPVLLADAWRGEGCTVDLLDTGVSGRRRAR